MAVVLEIVDRTLEAQAALGRLAAMLEKAGVQEDSLIKMDTERQRVMNDGLALNRALIESYTRLSTELRKFTADQKKFVTQADSVARSNTAIADSFRKINDALGTSDERWTQIANAIRAVSTEAKNATGDLAAASNAAGKTGGKRSGGGGSPASAPDPGVAESRAVNQIYTASLSSLDKLINKKNVLLGVQSEEVRNSARYKSALAGVEAAIEKQTRSTVKVSTEQKETNRVYNASRTPLQRMLDNYKALNQVTDESIRASEKYRQARTNLDAQLKLGFKRQEINDGRSLSQMLDNIANKMSVLPGPIGRMGGSLGSATRALSVFGAGEAAVATGATEIAAGASAAASGIGSVSGGASAATLVAGGLAAGVAAIGVGFVGAALYSKEFTQELKALQNISGASSDELVLLHDAAIRASSAGFAPEAAVKGLQDLAALGFNARDSITLLTPTLNLAAAGSMSVSEAATIAGSTLKAYSIDVEDAGLALDKLAAIGNMTGIQFTDLQQAIAKSAGAASLANQSIDEMLVTMGLARNTGLSMEEVATGATSALVNMSTVGRKKMKEYGIDLKDANGNFRQFGSILLDVTEKTKDFADPDRVTVLHDMFGTFGQKAVIPMMDQLSKGIATTTGEIVKGADALNYMRDSIGNAGGTLQKFTDNKLDTLAGQLSLFSASWSSLITIIGEGAEPAVKTFVEYGVKNLNVMIDTIRTMKDLWQNLFGDKRTLQALKGDLEALDNKIKILDPTQLESVINSSTVGAEKLSGQLKMVQTELEKLDRVRNSGGKVDTEEYRNLEQQMFRLQSRIRGLSSGAEELGRQKIRVEVDPAVAAKLEVLRKQAAAVREEIAGREKETDKKKEDEKPKPKVDLADTSTADAAARKAKGDREEALRFIDQWRQASAKATAEAAGGMARIELEWAEAIRQLEGERAKALDGVRGNKKLEEQIESAFTERKTSLHRLYFTRANEEAQKQLEAQQKDAAARLKVEEQFQKELAKLGGKSTDKVSALDSQIAAERARFAEAKYTTDQIKSLEDALKEYRVRKMDELHNEALSKASAYYASENDVARERMEKDLADLESLDLIKLGMVDEYERARKAIEERYATERTQAAIKEATQYAEFASQFASIITEQLEKSLSDRQALAQATKDEIADVDQKLQEAEFEQQKISLNNKKAMLQKELAAEQAAATTAFHARQAGAVSEALINAALAGLKIATQFPPPSPFFFVGESLLALQTGFALNSILSQSPPTYHGGGASLAPDEFYGKLKKGESVLSSTATDAIGVDTINRLNGGATAINRGPVIQRFVFNRQYRDLMLQDALDARSPLRIVMPAKTRMWGVKQA